MIKIIILFISYHAKILFPKKKMVLTKPQPLCLLVLDSIHCRIPNVNCIITLRSTRFRAPVTVSSTVNVKNFNRFYIFFFHFSHTVFIFVCCFIYINIYSSVYVWKRGILCVYLGNLCLWNDVIIFWIYKMKWL